MNVVIMLLGVILISISIRGWIISDVIDDINENLEKILRGIEIDK